MAAILESILDCLFVDMNTATMILFMHVSCYCYLIWGLPAPWFIAPFALNINNWSHLVINSTEFGEVTVKVSLDFDRQHASRRAMAHNNNDRTCFISTASSGGACSWTCASNCARSGNCCIYSGGRTRSNFDFCFKSSLALRFRNAGFMGSTFLSFRLYLGFRFARFFFLCLAWFLLLMNTFYSLFASFCSWLVTFRSLWLSCLVFFFLSPLYLAAWSHAGNSLSLYLPACWNGFIHILSFPFPLFGSACLFVPVNVVYPFYLFLFFATVLFSLRVSQSQRLERLYNSRYFLMTWRACSLDSCDMEFYVWPGEPDPGKMFARLLCSNSRQLGDLWHSLMR